MKKKIVLIVSGFLVAVSLFVGGVAFAAGWGVIPLPNDGELQYYGIDKASINVYSNVMSGEGNLGHEIKPEDLIVDVIGPDGNKVNFSELDVSYETLNPRTHQRKEISANEALKSDGTLNLEKYMHKYNEFMVVTFKYTYRENSQFPVESTISKSVTVDVAIL